MNIRTNSNKFLELNLAIIFISTSGVLGKHIDLPVPIIIFLRSFIAGIILFLYAKRKGFNFEMNRKKQMNLLLGGTFLGAHWITYFYSLKFSTVAIAMLSLYTYPVITAILESLFLKNKLLKMHVAFGLLILFGVYLIAPDININNKYFVGMGFGLLSALLYSIRNIMLKSQIDNCNQSIAMIYQLGVISILLVPTIGFFDSSNLVEYLPSTVLLAILTTAIGHTLFVYSLKHFSATSASLISSLQPIYGILLALIFLNEIPNLRIILGGIVIISTVIIESQRIKEQAK